ncbi:MAG: hypothetical protein IK058_00690 [Bacteroidales bacterium]|nr:hypothetical protein [Bacteroidales bacterium]
MKKIYLFLVLAATAATLAAQPAMTRGMESKRLSGEDLVAIRYVGMQDRLDSWIMEGRKHVKQVVLTDINLETVSVSPIAGSGDMEVLAASVDGDRTGVLLAQRGNRRTVVLRCEVDAESHAMVDGFDTVVVFEYGRKDVCMVWGATSPSGNYNALVCVAQMNDSKQYSTYTALFDGSMRRLWDKEYALGSLYDLQVTDSGRVVTMGEEREGDESHFIFNVLDSIHAVTYDATVNCDPVVDFHMVNVVGRHAVAVGTYRPAGGKKAEKLTAGVMTLAFNLDSAVLTGVTMRPFQNEDMNIFLNKKTKKIQKDQVCDHIVMHGCVATSYGAVLALGRDLVVEKSNGNGNKSRERHGVGVSLVSVDTTGRVRWVRNIRRNDMSKDDELPTIGLSAAGDRVCLAKNEGAKYPAIYDISDEAKEYKIGDKGNLVVYSIDADGTTEKLLLEKKSKQTVVRGLTRPDDTVLIFSVRGNKSRLTELRF